MLVLSRWKNEGILIGKDIRIVVIDVRGDKVRLGVEAPANVHVHREEIAKQILDAGGSLESREVKPDAA